jgi:hypothetical protein
MQNNQMAARYEYEVTELREKLFGGKLSADSLEKVLNDHAPDSAAGRSGSVRLCRDPHSDVADQLADDRRASSGA